MNHGSRILLASNRTTRDTVVTGPTRQTKIIKAETRAQHEGPQARPPALSSIPNQCPDHGHQFHVSPADAREDTQSKRSSTRRRTAARRLSYNDGEPGRMPMPQPRFRRAAGRQPRAAHRAQGQARQDAAVRVPVVNLVCGARRSPRRPASFPGARPWTAWSFSRSLLRCPERHCWRRSCKSSRPVLK